MPKPKWDETRGASNDLLKALDEYIETEFAGLLDPVANITRLVREEDGRVAAHWRIRGTHGTPGSPAQPSGASGQEFLGWQPTGKDVDLHVATFGGPGPMADKIEFVHEWDRLHGLFQIGVHAVGRPVVGSRPRSPAAPGA